MRVSAAKIKTGHVLNKIVFVSAVAPVTQYLLMFDTEFDDFLRGRSIIFVFLTKLLIDDCHCVYLLDIKTKMI